MRQVQSELNEELWAAQGVLGWGPGGGFVALPRRLGSILELASESRAQPEV